jgi:hypothetical protein
MTTVIDFLLQQMTWLDVFARISPLGWGLLAAVLVIMFLIYIVLSQSASFCHADEDRETRREHDKMRFEAVEKGLKAEISTLRVELNKAHFTIDQLKGFADQATKSHLVENTMLKAKIAEQNLNHETDEINERRAALMPGKQDIEKPATTTHHDHIEAQA